MVSDSGKSNNDNGVNKSPEESVTKSRKSIETYLIIALFCLIVALLLLSFNQPLFAGCLIIVSASIGVIIVRKSSLLHKKSEESLNNISALNKRKDELIKDFSHKIRGPLNNLVMLVDMIMDSGLRKDQKELMESFIASTNKMVSTVNELTMQSAGNMGFELRKSIKFNLFSTIQSTINLYNLKDKISIEFILDKKEFNDFECFGDPIILKQILLNIFTTIENNQKEGGTYVSINLSKSKLSDNESLISLKIKTDKNIVLIDDSSPDIRHSSQLISSGKGTFTLEIGTDSSVLTILLPYSNPINEPKEKSASLKIIELIQKDKIHKELKDLRILLVEDNLINKNITILTLKPQVSCIDTAANGKEALDMFGTNSYDLILMDIQMPVMSGLVAAEKIRALESTTNSHIPIIAITANAMIGDMEKCLSAGIDDYISKPFQPSVLIETIKRNT